MSFDDTTKEIIKHIALNKNDLVLVDMSYHLYRFFYAYKRLSINYEGVNIPTGHIYGFLRQICSLIREFNNPAIIIAIDGKDPERKEINENYKAHRPKREYEFYGDITKILEMLSVLGDRVYMSFHKNYEADDTIYAISTRMEKLLRKNNLDKEIYIFSADKDLYQCINGNTYVIKSLGKGKGNILKKADIVDVERVRYEFHGVGPENLVKFRALTGDVSDGLRGYYRFPRKLASYLANNAYFSNQGVVLPDDCDYKFSESDKQYLMELQKDYKLFLDNLKIMQLKDYDFKLRQPKSDRAWELVDFFKMNSFRKEVAELV